MRVAVIQLAYADGEPLPERPISAPISVATAPPTSCGSRRGTIW